MAVTHARAPGADLKGRRAEGEVPPHLADPALRPTDEAAAAHEEVAALSTAVQSLPDDYQVALTLRFRDRLSFAEIGQRLGRSEDAARKLVFRAMAEARGRLQHLQKT